MATEKMRGQIYEIFMLTLCVLSLVILGIDVFLAKDQEIKLVIDVFDFLICAAFLWDFVKNLYEAKNRWEYMQWGWIDLLSCIPHVDYLRLGRFARIIRILRVIRGIKSTKKILSYIRLRPAEASFWSVLLVCILISFLASVSILHFEKSADSNIKTAGDAVWWSFVTITTVGYGDFYPVTLEGRILAAILMVGGIGLFGTLSGYMGAWFINPVEAEEEDIERVNQQVQDLRAEILELKALLKQRIPEHPE